MSISIIILFVLLVALSLTAAGSLILSLWEELKETADFSKRQAH